MDEGKSANGHAVAKKKLGALRIKKRGILRMEIHVKSSVFLIFA